MVPRASVDAWMKIVDAHSCCLLCSRQYLNKERVMGTSQHLLYIGSYASAEQAGISVFAFEDATGELSMRGTFAGIVG
jgi:hypothetical protein